MGPQQPPFAKSISVIPRSVRVYVNIIRARNNQRPCDAPERGKKSTNLIANRSMSPTVLTAGVSNRWGRVQATI